MIGVYLAPEIPRYCSKAFRPITFCTSTITNLFKYVRCSITSNTNSSVDECASIHLVDIFMFISLFCMFYWKIWSKQCKFDTWVSLKILEFLSSNDQFSCICDVNNKFQGENWCVNLSLSICGYHKISFLSSYPENLSLMCWLICFIASCLEFFLIKYRCIIVALPSFCLICGFQIGVIIEDRELTESYMGGKPWKAGKFSQTLRLSLWSEHLGLQAGEVSTFQSFSCISCFMWLLSSDYIHILFLRLIK